MNLKSYMLLKLGVLLGVLVLAFPLGLLLMREFERFNVPGGRLTGIAVTALLFVAGSDLLTRWAVNWLGWRSR